MILTHRGLFSTQRKKRESCDYWLLMMTMHFRPLVVWKRFFLCLLLRSKRRVSVKDTHFNTPTTNKSIKYDDSKRFSLSLSLSLPLSSRKCCNNKRCSKKHYCRCSFVLLREHHRVDSKDVYTASVCVLFFMCIQNPQHYYTQATLECVLLGVLFCVWSFLRVHKKRRKKKKKKETNFF